MFVILIAEITGVVMGLNMSWLVFSVQLQLCFFVLMYYSLQLL